jgi:hypothetical protein
MELRVVFEELLKRTSSIRLNPDEKAVHAVYPAIGFAVLPLWIRNPE